MVFENKEELIDNEILTVLSMDGRAALDSIGKKINLTKHPTYRRVKGLEDRFGIRYLAEIDTEKLGYLKFLIFVKFLDKLPTNDEITAAIRNEPRIQFAAVLTGGEYNLLLYLLVENNSEINIIRRTLVVNSPLFNYRSEFYITPFYETYNFIPIREEFIDLLKSTKAEKGAGDLFEHLETATEKKKHILMREFAVLKELVSKGDIAFSDIDKKYGFDRGRSQYSYYKLRESKIIKRVTIALLNISVKYAAVLFLKVSYPKSYYKNRKRLLLSIVKNTNKHVNRFALVGDIGVPVGVMFILPVFDEEDLEKAAKDFSGIKGAELKVSVITKVVLGNLCYRKFDNAYSAQQEDLNKYFKAQSSI